MTVVAYDSFTIVAPGSASPPKQRWTWQLMSPGSRVRPSRRRVRPAGACRSSTTAWMRPSCTTTARPLTGAAPVPSMSVAPIRTRGSAMSVRNRLGPEEDVLRALEIGVVELADELLARRRGEVLGVLLLVVNLDAFDVVPPRRLGTGDGTLDAMRAIADDRRQRLGHPVVVLAQPALVVLRPHSRLQRRDHVPHRHRSAPLEITTHARHHVHLEPFDRARDGAVD